MTITEFLTARYDEEETAVRVEIELVRGRGVYIHQNEGVLRERRLADVAAKRAIVELASEWRRTALTDPDDEYLQGGADSFESAVEALAQPYAGHPDFREEWRA
jgi:hypothetical protein